MEEKMTKLDEIVQQYPDAIPVKVAAEFLGITPVSVQASLCSGKCPFGFYWQRGSRKGFCIPTIRFYLWVTGR